MCNSQQTITVLCVSTYTFSPATVSKTGGPTDIILTVKTRKLASNEAPKDLPGKISPIAFGLFLLPILGLRYSRRTSKKLSRMITNAVLLLASLGVIGAMSGCGSGYFDHNYPITITATSNGVQHSVNGRLPHRSVAAVRKAMISNSSFYERFDFLESPASVLGEFQCD